MFSGSVHFPLKLIFLNLNLNFYCLPIIMISGFMNSSLTPDTWAMRRGTNRISTNQVADKIVQNQQEESEGSQFAPNQVADNIVQSQQEDREDSYPIRQQITEKIRTQSGIADTVTEKIRTQSGSRQQRRFAPNLVADNREDLHPIWQQTTEKIHTQSGSR